MSDLEEQLSIVQGELTDKTDRLERLSGAVEQIRSKFVEAEVEFDELDRSASRFSYDDWQDVVYDVRREASDVEDGMSDIDSAISEAESIASE